VSVCVVCVCVCVCVNAHICLRGGRESGVCVRDRKRKKTGLVSVKKAMRHIS
jgi:hypothetical protein